MAPTTLRLNPGEAAVFGYGSLLSMASLERTLNRAYDGPFIPCRVDGWRRSWDIAMPNREFWYEGEGGRQYPERICYLNVHRAPGIAVNGVLFVVSRAELAALDEREWIYDRLAIAAQLREAIVAGGEAWMYVAKPEFVIRGVSSPNQAAIRGSYLTLIEAGLSDLGRAFRVEYERSSEPVPGHLVIHDHRDAPG